MTDDTLETRLRTLGYEVHEPYVHNRTMFVVISGEGIAKCAVYRREAEALSRRRVTLTQLRDRRVSRENP